MLGAIVIYNQLRFIQEKDMGFEKEQLIFLRFKNQLFTKAVQLKSELLTQTSIQSVTATSNNLMDGSSSTHRITWEGQNSEDAFPMAHMIVDPDFLSATG